MTTFELGLSIISLVVGVPVGALLLMFSTKIFKTSDTSYLTAIKVTAILGIISFLFSLMMIFVPILSSSIGVILLGGLQIIVGIVVGLFLIKSFYLLDWKQAFLVWILYFVFNLVLGLFLAGLIGIIVFLLFLAPSW